LCAVGALAARSRRADGTRIEIRRLLRLQLDEESGLRGYAATREPVFLESYYQALRSLPGLQATLARKLSGDPRQATRLDRFARLHAAWQRRVAAPILRAPLGRRNRTREVIGKVLVDAVRADLARIDAAYARSARADAAWSRAIGDVTAVVVALVLAALAGLAYATERRRARTAGRLAVSLVKASDSVGRMNGWRAKVITMLAHDFKAALEAVEPHARRHDVARLAAIADETLLMTQIAHGRLQVQPEPVPINQVLADVADRYRPHRTVSIYGAAPDALGDSAYLFRVFDNIVENAVKYSPASAPIAIRVRSVDGGVISIAIEDSGDGIRPHDLPHVFEESWRAPNSGTSSNGGIGLFVVKKLVDALGGSIHVRSRSGAGTTVLVLLPAAGE
jgi:signal transduction histidine kinase